MAPRVPYLYAIGPLADVGVAANAADVADACSCFGCGVPSRELIGKGSSASGFEYGTVSMFCSGLTSLVLQSDELNLKFVSAQKEAFRQTLYE